MSKARFDDHPESTTENSQTAVLSPEERRAQGSALRDAVSREAQGGWKPPKKRRDPIDLLVASNEGRMPELVPIRFGRMLQSAFTFYRGSAAIMAADLASTPDLYPHLTPSIVRATAKAADTREGRSASSVDDRSE